MRPRSFSPLIAIILITGAFFVGVIAIALSQSLVRDFDPILYTSRSGLCSPAEAASVFQRGEGPRFRGTAAQDCARSLVRTKARRYRNLCDRLRHPL